MEHDFVKVTNAAYKILDFFPEADPLKNKIKEKVLSILENVTLISGTNGWTSFKKEKASAELLDDIEILETYLKLAKYQGWIDSINFLILTKEYHKLKSEIHPPKGIIKQTLEIASGAESNSPVLERGNKATMRRDNLNENYSERQKKILQILSQREKAQVSDIIKELPDVTKRTIRRDLDDLLKRGRIIRVGEWNQVFYRIPKENSENRENRPKIDRTIRLS